MRPYSTIYIIPHAVAVDMSPAQNAVLELKLAAIKHLSYIEFLTLIGEKDDHGRQRCVV